MKIDSKDLYLETFNVIGLGVITGSNGVRITHLPTEIVVSCGDHPVYQDNLKEAMEELRSKISGRNDDGLREINS